jgi:signal peptidase I
MQNHSETFQTEEISQTNSTLREFIGFMRDLVIIFIIVIIIRSFIVTPFRINGSSMEMSYHDKEYIIVDKFSYLNLPITFADNLPLSNTWDKLSSSILRNIPLHIGDPERWDVVVITPHVDRQKEYYIKRVIGLPGDTLLFQDGEVLIKKPGAEKFIQIKEWYLSSVNIGQTRLPENVKTNQFLIPEGYYWVMWDNRNNSADSRSCFKSCIGETAAAHFIKRKDIIGKVLINLGYYNIVSPWGLLDAKKWTWTYPPRFFTHPRSATYSELGE